MASRSWQSWAMSRPYPLQVAAEIRAVGEFGSFALGAPVLRRFLPTGSRPVFVMPGFLAEDISTSPLRKVLDALGHTTYGWDLGRNLGPTPQILDGIVERLDELHQKYGEIDIIGWSLGGIYARELARIAPHAIRQVITLGSPFQIETPSDSNASAAYRSLSHLHAPELEMRVPAYVREPLEVPATSIYTRSDGVVRWQHCLNHDEDHTENVEVYGSHCGLGFNLAALIVVADRLAQPIGGWRPFRVRRTLRTLFPTAPTYRVPAA